MCCPPLTSRQLSASIPIKLLSPLEGTHASCHLPPLCFLIGVNCSFVSFMQTFKFANSGLGLAVFTASHKLTSRNKSGRNDNYLISFSTANCSSSTLSMRLGTCAHICMPVPCTYLLCPEPG